MVESGPPRKPENTIICIDGSEETRNGDVQPSRLDSLRAAVLPLIQNKLSQHPESRVGLILLNADHSPTNGEQSHRNSANNINNNKNKRSTSSGNRQKEQQNGRTHQHFSSSDQYLSSLSREEWRMAERLLNVRPAGELSLSAGIAKAQLIIRYKNKRLPTSSVLGANSRIIVFIASDIRQDDLDSVRGHYTGKNDIKLDIVTFESISDNVAKLQVFAREFNQIQTTIQPIRLFIFPPTVVLKDELGKTELFGKNSGKANPGAGTAVSSAAGGCSDKMDENGKNDLNFGAIQADKSEDHDLEDRAWIERINQRVVQQLTDLCSTQPPSPLSFESNSPSYQSPSAKIPEIHPPDKQLLLDDKGKPSLDLAGKTTAGKEAFLTKDSLRSSRAVGSEEEGDDERQQRGLLRNNTPTDGRQGKMKQQRTATVDSNRNNKEGVIDKDDTVEHKKKMKSDDSEGCLTPVNNPLSSWSMSTAPIMPSSSSFSSSTFSTTTAQPIRFKFSAARPQQLPPLSSSNPLVILPQDANYKSPPYPKNDKPNLNPARMESSKLKESEFLITNFKPTTSTPFPNHNGRKEGPNNNIKNKATTSSAVNKPSPPPPAAAANKNTNEATPLMKKKTNSPQTPNPVKKPQNSNKPTELGSSSSSSSSSEEDVVKK